MSPFGKPVESPGEIQALYGEPLPRAQMKEIAALDGHCRSFIAHSPLVMLATADAQGRLDVSPKGGPAGFVQVLGDRHLAIPDAPGNRRIDSFRNLFENPGIALLFAVPGITETLRVMGTAVLSRDPDLLERISLRGKPARVVIGVTVESAFLHCGKAFVRSSAWKPDEWPDTSGLPSAAEILRDHRGDTHITVEQEQAALDESYAKRMW